MVTMSEYRIAPLWRIGASGFIFLGVVAWRLGDHNISSVLGLLLAAWMLLVSYGFRLIIQPEGFSIAVMWFQAKIFPVSEVRWADIVELRDWEFLVFEEVWGIMAHVKDRKGRIRQVNIPGTLDKMSEILQTVLQHIPSNVVVDPHLRWRVQQFRKSKQPNKLKWFFWVCALMLVAICIGIGILGFTWFEQPIVKWTALITSILFAGYLGARIYKFR